MSGSLWSELRSQLRLQLDPDEFATWIGPLRAREDGDGRLVLLAPNERFRHTLEASYRPAVDRAIAGLDDRAVEVLIAVDGSRVRADDARADDTRTGPARSDGSRSRSKASRGAAGRKTESPASASRQAGAAPFNARYVFETFVVGTSNEFAHAAAKAVADKPSESYNPLFLYGGVGLGKTHLLHAIAHQIRSQRQQLRIMYLAAEQFVNDLINSIRFDRMPAFRERYRTIDVLLIDDIQFIAGKERTQEEFFHTFNTLFTSQKQIILSSDTSPRQIPTLEERLRSRFEWGLIADIQPPELETKEAILRRKAETEEVDLPDEVAHFIARRVRSNIRELEGLLNRVIAFSMLTGKPLSLELAKETLKDILPEDNRRLTSQEIVKQVAKNYGLKVSEIKSRSNSRQIAFPRQVAMYLCKRLTELSFPEIGKLFNDKHHSTVMYSVDKIESLRESDEDLDRTLRELTERFERF